MIHIELCKKTMKWGPDYPNERTTTHDIIFTSVYIDGRFVEVYYGDTTKLENILHAIPVDKQIINTPCNS